jgi:hypothetical protein
LLELQIQSEVDAIARLGYRNPHYHEVSDLPDTLITDGSRK